MRILLVFLLISGCMVEPAYSCNGWDCPDYFTKPCPDEDHKDDIPA